jgi:inorganic triphosphatase YgiF
MSRRGTEFEIKLIGAPREVAALRQSARLLKRALAPPSMERLVTTYYDSEGGVLRKSGLSLRLREENSGRVQCVKLEAKGGGALRRYEEERALRPGESFPAAIEDEEAARTIAQAGALAPVCRSVSDRWTIELGRKKARLEIAIELGRLEARKNGDVARAAPLAEVEIELLSGDESAAFAEARAFVRLSDGALRPTFRSKASRARHLLRKEPYPDEPDIAYSADASCGAALSAALGAAAIRMSDLQYAVADLRSPNGLHQMRVALRKLLAIQRMFSEVLKDDRLDDLMRRTRRTFRRFHAARDWDVFAGDILAPLLSVHSPGGEPLRAAAAARQSEGWEEASAAAGGVRFSRLVLDLAQAAVMPPWRDLDAAEAPAAAFAVAALDRLLNSVKRKARDLDWNDASARHPLRLQLKKLRYAAQLFAPLFAPPEIWGASLSNLQDDLGALNDAALAQAFADEAARGGGKAAVRAAGFVYGYYASAQAPDIDAVRRNYEALVSMPPFWR